LLENDKDQAPARKTQSNNPEEDQEYQQQIKVRHLRELEARTRQANLRMKYYMNKNQSQR